MAAKLEQKKCYLAYLDILGFKGMLQNKGFGAKISELVEALERRANFDRKRHPYLQYLAVSDTIIVLAEEGSAYFLLWKISQVQNKLLTLGFCLRGGIAFGEVLVYGDNPVQNIFGQTLVEAYVLESEFATYPRVTIKEDIVSKIKTEVEKEKCGTSDIFVFKDADGCGFVNQFARDIIYATVNTNSRKKKNAHDAMCLYASSIKAGVGFADIKSRLKWNWLSNQHTRQFNNIW